MFKVVLHHFKDFRAGQLDARYWRVGPDVSALSDPQLPEIDRAWNLALTGVGGTGVLTIGAILGMAAHIEGRVPMILDMAGLAQKGGAVLSHVRISRRDRPATAPRIAAGTADLLIGADSVVAASKDSLLLCDPDRTDALLNTKITPVSDFVRLRDFDFQEAAVERLVEKTVRNRDHYHDFSDLAAQLTGDEIGANMMMLGYAWQKGLVPVGREAIAKAIELNGVAIPFNIASFEWGRLLADNASAVLAKLAPVDAPKKTQDELSTEELIAQRAGHLTKYQNAALARRYTERLDSLSTVVSADTLRQAAISYARVLAYKDEYEVARLYSDPAFRDGLAATFDGDYRLSFNLAPPFLPGEDATGRPKKREFGPWILPVFRMLAKFKPLRGTWADPFGRSEDRKIETALIGLHEDDLDLAQQLGNGADPALVKELLALPQQVRGYGPVKQSAYEKQTDRRDQIRATLLNGKTTATAA